jgi:hypothetical protein
MKTAAIVAASLILAAPAFAEPAAGVDHSGGPTATAGSADQPSQPPTSKPTPKHRMHKSSSSKTKSEASASTAKQPSGTGSTTTPSGR